MASGKRQVPPYILARLTREREPLVNLKMAEMRRFRTSPFLPGRFRSKQDKSVRLGYLRLYRKRSAQLP